MVNKYSGYTLVEKNILNAFYNLKKQNASLKKVQEEINWILSGMGSAYGYVVDKLIQQGYLNVFLNESMTRVYYIEVKSENYITPEGMKYCEQKFGRDLVIRPLEEVEN